MSIIEKTGRTYKSPFIGEENVIRKNGQIAVLPYIPYGTKNPVIIPNYVTHLLVNRCHRNFGHAKLLKAAVNSLVLLQVPKIVPLPLARIMLYVRGFTFVLLDYLGPLTV